MAPFAINFYLLGEGGQFAFRRLPGVPREGELVVFNDRRYNVCRVEWCLDADATERGTRINIEICDACLAQNPAHAANGIAPNTRGQQPAQGGSAGAE